MTKKIESILRPYFPLCEIPLILKELDRSNKTESEKIALATFIGPHVDAIRNSGKPVPPYRRLIDKNDYEFDRTPFIPIVEEKIREIKAQIDIDENVEESLDLTCRRCKGHFIKPIEVQKRSSDEPPSWVYTCYTKDSTGKRCMNVF